MVVVSDSVGPCTNGFIVFEELCPELHSDAGEPLPMLLLVLVSYAWQCHHYPYSCLWPLLEVICRAPLLKAMSLVGSLKTKFGTCVRLVEICVQVYWGGYQEAHLQGRAGRPGQGQELICSVLTKAQ